ncbi:hypothetical protein TVAG_364960 [Trichomonas vaginalis G3]|uniref:ABC-2 type transporter transmembrane domain-containing protein n=1 Tax=Trichomonas vaginalis (strain ATCC PRA-98 / G3) TaxID=412133 RepID=A2FU47_TRIV3|nr:hypothetical protein TVAG_364960 [Trichomonas vaginalis G3]|eukprot:XP_001304499.1 hypothetical protein [Trichomonas vaginalis G3]
MFTNFFRHVYAVIYRRAIIHRRSKLQLARSIFMTILSSFAALFVQYRAAQHDRVQVNPFSYSGTAHKNHVFAVITLPMNRDKYFVSALVNDTQQLIKNESGHSIPPIYFNTSEEFDSWVYSTTNSSFKNNIAPGKLILFAYEIMFNGKDVHITFYHNHSMLSSARDLYNIQRLVHKRLTDRSDANLKISHVPLIRHISSSVTASSIPAFITFGVINICILFISQAIEDSCSERRPYMLLCGLSKIEYWIGCFIGDYVVWVFVTTCFWYIYIFAKTPMFIENKFLTWSILQLSGPGILFLVYCVSFLFSNPDTGSNYVYFILMLPFIIFSMASDISPNRMFNQLLEYVQYAYPISNLFMMLSLIGMNQWKEKLKLTIALAAGIFLALLILIEFTIIYAEKNATKINFSLYIDEFLKRREYHVSVGAKEHENDVKSGRNSYLLKITDCCRIFFTA